MAENIVDPYENSYNTQPEAVYDPNAERRGKINDAYRKYLGRDADAQGYDAWEANDNYEQGIAGSPEAQAYARRQGGGSANTWDEGAFRRGWESGGYQNANDLRNYITQGGWGNHVQVTGSKGDKIRLPDGRVIDAVYAQGLGGRGAQWLDESNNVGGGAGQPGVGGGLPPEGPAMIPGGASGTGPGSKWDELYQLFMTRAKQGTAIDKNDPNIRQQADPMIAAQERARRDYLADQAERSGPLANLRGEERLATERAGQATGLLESQLVGRELTSRREEIQHALDSSRGMLSQEQTMNLQRELAKMDDAIRRYGIEVQNNQFGRNLEQQESQFGRNFGEGQRQYNNNFGQRMGESEMEFWLRSQGL